MTSSQVINIEKVKSKFVIKLKSRGKIEARFLINTLPPPVASRIFNSTFHRVSEMLNRIKYLSCICTIILTKRKNSDYYWIINTMANKNAVITAFEYTNLATNTPGGLVYGVRYVNVNDTMLYLDEKSLLDIFIKDLSRLLEGFSVKDILGYKVVKIDYASPIYDLAYRNPPIRTDVKGLYLAGIYRMFPCIRSMGPAIKSGLLAAKTVIKDLSH